MLQLVAQLVVVLANRRICDEKRQKIMLQLVLLAGQATITGTH
jgi:hypothetical protein